MQARQKEHLQQSTSRLAVDICSRGREFVLSNPATPAQSTPEPLVYPSPAFPTCWIALPAYTPLRPVFAHRQTREDLSHTKVARAYPAEPGLLRNTSLF